MPRILAALGRFDLPGLNRRLQPLQETEHSADGDGKKLRRLSRMGYHDIDEGRWN
jgi:hypothetical protein